MSVYMYVCLDKKFKIHPGSTKIFEMSTFFLPSSPSQFLSGRVLYTRQPTAPSIPAAGQCHGYEEGEDGTLLPQEQPQHDPTMGPAYYNTSHVGGGEGGRGERVERWRKGRNGEVEKSREGVVGVEGRKGREGREGWWRNSGRRWR